MGLFKAVGNLVRRISSYPPPPPAPAPVELSAAEIEWARVKDFVRGCERHGLSLGGLLITDPVGFWTRHGRIEEATRAGMPLERAAVNEGFQGAQHWLLVERYFRARYSELVTRTDGSMMVAHVNEFRRAAELAAAARERARADAKALEPVQGITLERFAQIAATLLDLGPEPSRAELSHVLNGIGIGPARYGAARRAWVERIKGDTSGRLKLRYLEAFADARRAVLAQGGSGVHQKDDIDGTARAAARRSWVDLTFAS